MNRRLLALTVTGLALALGACGDDDDEGSSSETAATTETAEQAAPDAARTIEVSETEFKITPASIEVAEAGPVEFQVTNDGQTTHALEVERGDQEEETADIAPGESASLTVELEDGEYKLYCPIGDHEERGMTATLVVAGASATGDDSSGSGGAEAPGDDSGSGSDDSPSGDGSGGAAAPGDDNSGGASAPSDDDGY